MVFRWTPRRDRDLQAAIEDHFTYREAANMVGNGCTEGEARARMKALRAEGIPERGVSYGSQGPDRPVIGPDPAEFSSPPVTAKGEAAGGDPGGTLPPPLPVRRPPPTLIPLPKYGEMEKTYDPLIRRITS